MKSKKKLSRKMKGTMALAAVAAGLLLVSGIGSTRAALTYFSEDYTAHMEVQNIGVSLVENGNIVSYRDYDYTDKNNQWHQSTGDLLSSMLSSTGDENVVIGKAYPEVLTVTNSGSIDEYVRVFVTKYWEDEDGNKDVTVSPLLIDLNFTTGNGWVIDESAGSAERTVLYYTNIVPVGASTPAFTDTIKIDAAVNNRVTEETVSVKDGYTVITTKYDYDGKKFVVKAEVNAVQTHNAADAIKSAGGVNVSVGGNGSYSIQ